MGIGIDLADTELEESAPLGDPIKVADRDARMLLILDLRIERGCSGTALLFTLHPQDSSRPSTGLTLLFGDWVGLPFWDSSMRADKVEDLRRDLSFLRWANLE